MQTEGCPTGVRSRPIRVVFLTHYFPPEVGAPQTRISQLAAGLAEGGFEVTIHTCPPHYPDGHVLAPYRNALWQAEWQGPVRVGRSAVIPAPNRGLARRLADHASFAVSAVATSAKGGPADVVIVESPPLFLAAAGVAYARRLKAPMILNVADLWPDSAVELGVLSSRGAIRTARALERFAYRHAAAITAPTAGIVLKLRMRPEGAGKGVRMPPFVDRTRFDVGAVRREEGPLRLLYAGTTGMAQGLGTLLEAARIAGPEVVRVRIAGGGAEEPELRRRAEGLSNVELLGVRPAHEIPELYRESHVAAVLLRDVPLFRGALPTKLFEAMAARRPLVVAASGESAELVDRTGSGVVVRPEDPAALADALRTLAGATEYELRDKGEAGRRAIAAHGPGHALDRWTELLGKVTGLGLRSRP